MRENHDMLRCLHSHCSVAVLKTQEEAHQNNLNVRWHHVREPPDHTSEMKTTFTEAPQNEFLGNIIRNASRW
jgi:hypothetical protein